MGRACIDDMQQCLRQKKTLNLLPRIWWPRLECDFDTGSMGHIVKYPTAFGNKTTTDSVDFCCQLSGWLFMVHSPLRITWHISISFWDSFHELANEHAFAGYWCHTNANVFGLSWLVKAVQLELLEILAVKEGRVGGFSLIFQTYLGWLDDPQWLIAGHTRHTRMLATKPTTCMLPLLARTKVTTDGRAKKVSADPKQDDMANYGDVLSLHTVVLCPNSCKTLFRLGPVAEAM